MLIPILWPELRWLAREDQSVREQYVNDLLPMLRLSQLPKLSVLLPVDFNRPDRAITLWGPKTSLPSSLLS